MQSNQLARHRRGGAIIRLFMALVVALISLFSYCQLSVENPVTDESQRIDLSVEEEIALGLAARQEVAAQHGGLHPNQELQERVERIGRRIVERSEAQEIPYRFDFHVLADEETINAMALPGGQIFITAGLLQQLRTEGEVAGVLGHEVAHVVGRHAAEQLAKARLTQGLTGAAAIAAYDPENPGRTAAGTAVAAAIGQLVNLRYGRQDELEADRLGVQFMTEAGYDPRALLRVMEVLEQAGEGPRPPEFFSTHPNPGNRLAQIRDAIAERYPQGVPEDLKP